MSSTYSNLKIELIGTGEQSGSWGSTTNTNLGTAIEEAIVGRATVDFATDANKTITLTNTNATQDARHFVLNVTSSTSLTTTRTLFVPAIQKPYLIQNNTTGGQSITVSNATGTGVTVANGKTAFVYNDGTNVVDAITYLANLTIYGGTITGITDLAVADGGTGASNATNARANLGAAASGTNSDITSLTGLTTPLSIAQGGTNATNATAAFNGLSPITTKGDLITNDGTNDVRLGIGSNNQVLVADSTQASGMKWSSVPGATLATSITSAATITPDVGYSQYNVTALAVPATFAAPSAGADGQKLVLRIKDNGTARALTWTTSSGGYRVIGTTLPTTTVAGKVMYVGMVYNSQDTYWDVASIITQT